MVIIRIGNRLAPTPSQGRPAYDGPAYWINLRLLFCVTINLMMVMGLAPWFSRVSKPLAALAARR
jgi:hypothetical protein